MSNRPILFIRHAETDLAGAFCGHTDPELNTRGRAQAAALAAQLQATPIHAIYTSDLRRAQATARALADPRRLPCHLLPALREIDFGRWEGLTWPEIERLDPAFATLWIDSFPALPAPGGESFASFEQRVLQAVSSLPLQPGTQLAPTRPIAVVTHAGVLRVILERLCNVPPAHAWERTRRFCSIVRYQPR